MTQAHGFALSPVFGPFQGAISSFKCFLFVCQPAIFIQESSDKLRLIIGGVKQPTNIGFSNSFSEIRMTMNEQILETNQVHFFA